MTKLSQMYIFVKTAKICKNKALFVEIYYRMMSVRLITDKKYEKFVINMFNFVNFDIIDKIKPKNIFLVKLQRYEKIKHF